MVLIFIDLMTLPKREFCFTLCLLSCFISVIEMEIEFSIALLVVYNLSYLVASQSNITTGMPSKNVS